MPGCLPKRLTGIEAKVILSAYGIPVNPAAAAASAAEAKSAAQAIGYPVLLKLNAPDLEVQEEKARVIKNLADEAQVGAAFARLLAQTRERYPQAPIPGVTVQAQEREPDLELFVSSRHDPHFGPLLAFGAGGPLAGVCRDIAVDLPPLNLLLARRFMERTRIFHRPWGESARCRMLTLTGWPKSWCGSPNWSPIFRRSPPWVKVLVGEVLTQNQPMLELAKKVGFACRRTEDPQLCRIELPLL